MMLFIYLPTFTDYFIIDASRVVQQPRSIADSQSLEVVKQNLATNSLTFDARVSRGHIQQVSGKMIDTYRPYVDYLSWQRMCMPIIRVCVLFACAHIKDSS